jgi:hypothetical protein
MCLQPGAFPIASVVEAGISFNSPLLLHASDVPFEQQPMFTVSPLSVGCMPILDTVKLAESDDGTVILRLYEALGGRGPFTLTS